MICTSCKNRESDLDFGHSHPCNKCFIHILEARMKKEFRGLDQSERLFLLKRAPLSKFIIKKLLMNPNITTVRKNPTKVVLGITLDEEIASFFAGIDQEKNKVLTPFRGITLQELEAYARLTNVHLKREEPSGLEKEFNDFFNTLEHRRSGTKFSVLKSIDKLREVLDSKKF